jgi:predicted phosphodiesterase
VLWETSEPSKAIAFLAEAKHNTLHPDFTVIRQNSKAEKMHTIQYEGLSRGTQYIYQIASVIGSDTLWGPISRFDISDYKEEPIVCIVFGDTQRNPSLLEHFAGMFAKECPSFLLHIGDLVESGHNKKCWTDEFFYPLRDLLRFYPLYPVLGNHEGNTPFYYQYFDLPEPEWFYTQKKGNALFVFVNTNLDILPGSKQYQMLEKTLALSDEQWKIVIHHHPVYVSSGYYDLMTQKVSTGDPNLPHLRTLYDTYGVDVVYNGHIHNYERTMPIYQGRIDIAKGVTYITAGGGGGRLDDTPISRTWFMAEAKSKHHYIKMKIWDRTLSVYAIDSTGITFDHWEKVKNKVDLSVPLIESNELCFLDQTQVTVKNSNPDSDLVIQVNGSYHSTTSEEIQIILNETTVLTAFVKNKTGEESRPVTKKFTKLPLMNAHKKRTKDKIKVEYYEGFYTVLPDFDKQKPLKTFEVDTLSLDVIKPRAENHWAARSYGRFTVAETKVYRILLESYDGSRLLIDGKEIINNDGMHYEIRMDNYVALEKGEHTFEVQYFDFTRRETLRLWMNPIYSDLIEFNEYIR